MHAQAVRSRHTLFALRAMVVMVAAFPGAVRADVYQEFTGTRSEAMGGAHRGVGTSNDTIFLNPAFMSLVPRFSLDGYYGYSGQDSLSHISFSALDSKTGPIGGALAYTHDRGDHDFTNAELHRIYFATSYALFDFLALGFTGRHVRGAFNDERGLRQNVETYSADLALAMRLFDLVGIGVTYHNVLSTSRPRMTPPHLGTGAALTWEGFVVAVDVDIDLRQRHMGDLTVKTGAEYFLFNMFPLRFGYRWQPRIRRDGEKEWENILGGGIGYVGEVGAIEITYTHSINVHNNWDVIGALKLFL